MILKLSYLGSITLYVIVFLFSAYASKIKINKIVKIAIISFLPFLIAGYRYNVGWDYGSYARGFDLYDTSVSFFEILKEYKIGDSVGLNLVLLITKSLNSKFLFFAITSALSFVPAVLYLIDEWDDEKKILPLTIFVTGFSLFFTGMSAIKQGIAISFCLYSLKYVYRREVIKYIVFVAIAFLFHSSALIFIPVYFLWGYNNNISTWKKICAILLCFIFIIGMSNILSIFGGDRFEAYGTEVLITNNYSFYLMLFWLIIFMLFRRELIAVDTRNDLLILLYTVAVILMLVGFRNAFSKRIASYFEVVQIMLIPELVFVFNKRSRTIATVLIALYFVLICMMYNSGTAENMAPIPYSFIFGELR